VRGIYLATHFGNWHVNAPAAVVCAYIADLAARGTNHLMLWLDLSNCTSLESPEAQTLLARVRCLLAAGRAAGMRVGLARVANEAWRNSPPELRADPSAGRGAIMLSDLCASRPEARRLMEQTSEQVFGLFEHLDFVCLWPYDSGGCGCAGCRPWGANGFLVSAELMARAFRRRFPAGQVILSTWLMTQSEWRDVRAALESGRLDWASAVMAEVFRDGTPPDLLAGDVPHGLPLLGFPEISMEGMTPWGGCGANPRPAAIAARWQTLGRHVAGGFPYSEGMYEDVNKAIYAGLYLEPDRPVEDILRGYLAREFGPAVVDDGLEMLRLMETTLPRNGLAVKNLDAADRVAELAARMHRRLAPETAAGWRWQVLYRRARIDALLKAHAGRVTDELRLEFAVLHALYHTDETSLLGWLLPPLPPGRESPEPGNLAAHRPVTVSSSDPAGPGGSAALTDDVVATFDPDNFWCSAAGDPEPWVQVDLGRPLPVADAALQFRAAAGKNGWYYYQFLPAKVTVEVSLDGAAFEAVVRDSRDVPVEGQLYKPWFYRYPVGRTARYVRVRLGPSQAVEGPLAGCIQLSEVRVHGPAAAATGEPG
jgi:hypothetical protein